MIIQHNLASMNANRNLGINTNLRSKSTEKMSSGYSINRSSDDNSGTSVSEKMRSQIRGLNQASSNLQDGISLIQVADGGMSEIADILNRLKELAVKSANDIYTDADRYGIQKEVNFLLDEVNNIANTTKFNTIPVLNNTYMQDTSEGVGLAAVLGSGNITSEKFLSATLTINDGSGNTSYAAAFLNFEGLGADYTLEDLYDQGFNSTCATCSNHYSIRFTDGIDVKTSMDYSNYILDIGIEGLVATPPGTLGEALVDTILDALSDPDASPMVDHFTSYVGDGATLYLFDNRPEILNAYNRSDTFSPTVYMSGGVEIPERKDLRIQAGGNEADGINITLPWVTTERMGLSGLDVTSHEAASSAIAFIDRAAEYLSTERARMGAYENRFGASMSIASLTAENAQNAESRIRDTDISSEAVTLATTNILTESAQNILAQAARDSERIVDLLR